MTAMCSASAPKRPWLLNVVYIAQPAPPAASLLSSCLCAKAKIQKKASLAVTLIAVFPHARTQPFFHKSILGQTSLVSIKSYDLLYASLSRLVTKGPVWTLLLWSSAQGNPRSPAPCHPTNGLGKSKAKPFPRQSLRSLKWSTQILCPFLSSLNIKGRAIWAISSLQPFCQ